MTQKPVTPSSGSNTTAAHRPPSSTSLRDRVRGQAPDPTRAEPPPPDLTRALEAIRQDAATYFDLLGQSPRGLKNWDLTTFMQAIRAVCVDPAIAAWDASPLTVPPNNGQPIKRLTGRGEPR